MVSATGGAERAASVLSGLRGLAGHAADTDWVMVHDVARPCVTRADCVRLLTAVANDVAGGLLALPVTDTVKQVGSDEYGVFALRTVPRDDLWSAQTPQVFRFGVLRQALLAAMASGGPITDEASAVEQLGWRPRLVRGSATNLKITWPEDLTRAAVIIAAQVGSA